MEYLPGYYGHIINELGMKKSDRKGGEFSKQARIFGGNNFSQAWLAYPMMP